MMRWWHYHNVTKLLAAQHIISDTVRSQSIWQLRPGEVQDVLRHGGRPASQLYWHFSTLPSLHRETEGADQAERCVVSGARSRPAAGVGLFAPMPTPLRNRQRFRMRTDSLRPANHIEIGHWNSLGHNMITNTAYSTGKPPYSISPYSSSGRRIFSDADVGGAAASD
jgi:hypothetical protein